MAAESKADVTLSSDTWTLVSANKCIIQSNGGSCRVAFGAEPTVKDYGLRLQADKYLSNNEAGNCYAIAEDGMNVYLSLVEY